MIRSSSFLQAGSSHFTFRAYTNTTTPSSGCSHNASRSISMSLCTVPTFYAITIRHDLSCTIATAATIEIRDSETRRARRKAAKQVCTATPKLNTGPSFPISETESPVDDHCMRGSRSERKSAPRILMHGGRARFLRARDGAAREDAPDTARDGLSPIFVY